MKTPMSVFAVRVLIPVLLIVAVLGVMRGFFQGLGTMMPSATSQILEQIANAIVSVWAAYVLADYGAKAGALLGDADNYSAAYGAAGGTPLYWLYICVRSNAVCTESGKETLIPMARYFICLS